MGCHDAGITHSVEVMVRTGECIISVYALLSGVRFMSINSYEVD